eukprot:11258852-Alexandrium_andersonii.AAC.1
MLVQATVSPAIRLLPLPARARRGGAAPRGAAQHGWSGAAALAEGAQAPHALLEGEARRLGDLV